MARIMVTLRALRKFAKDNKAAQERLDEAKAEMKAAADDLCSRWEGEAATAFAEEQNRVTNWFVELLRIGATYVAAVLKAADTFEAADNDIKIHS